MQISRNALFAAMVAAISAAPAMAEDKPWWPIKVYDATSGKKVVVDYTPLEKARQTWNVCVLFPTMKDSYWTALGYGIVTEAERQGINMTLQDAGGYTNLTEQIAQFDACMTPHVDAIIIGPVDPSRFAAKLKAGMAAGKPIIVAGNPVPQADVVAEVFVDYASMGSLAGKLLLDTVGDADARVVAFPGPADSGWAEDYLQGFTGAIDGSKIEILDAMYGDTGVSDQAKLVSDALDRFQSVDFIWGAAPAAQAAIAARETSGRDFKIIASYENEAMPEALNDGSILGFAVQYAVLEGKVALDMAVRAMESAPLTAFVQPIPDMVTKETIGGINMDLVLAPTDWKPVYEVKN